MPNAGNYRSTYPHGYGWGQNISQLRYGSPYNPGYGNAGYVGYGNAGYGGYGNAGFVGYSGLNYFNYINFLRMNHSQKLLGKSYIALLQPNGSFVDDVNNKWQAYVSNGYGWLPINNSNLPKNSTNNSNSALKQTASQPIEPALVSPLGAIRGRTKRHNLAAIAREAPVVDQRATNTMQDKGKTREAPDNGDMGNRYRPQ